MSKSTISRAAAMLLMMLTAATAWAGIVRVNYIDANGVLQNTATDNIAGNDSPTVLTNETDISEPLPSGWYVVNGEVSFSDELYCGGETTGITNTNLTNRTNKTSEWYDLSGRKLNNYM